MDIIADASQYVTDAGQAHGVTALQAQEEWRELRSFPDLEQVIFEGSDLFSMLVAYSSEDPETLRAWTPQERGAWFISHVIPSLTLTTPAPKWATDTDDGFAAHDEAVCIHSADLAPRSRIAITAVREDTYETSTGTLTIGDVVANVEGYTEDLTSAQLREIASDFAAAADRLEAIEKSEAEK